MSSRFILHYQIYARYSQSFTFPYEFENQLVNFGKDPDRIEAGVALKDYIDLGRTDILTILHLPIREHSTSLRLFNSS